MPVFAPPLIIYQTGPQAFRVVLKCTEETTFSFESVSEWTKIEVQANSEGVMTLQINDLVVSGTTGCLAPQEVVLGRGFLDRYWSGETAEFRFWNGVDVFD